MLEWICPIISAFSWVNNLISVLQNWMKKKKDFVCRETNKQKKKQGVTRGRMMAVASYQKKKKMFP